MQNVRVRELSGVLALAALLLYAGCSKRQVATTVPGTVNPADSSYTALKAGDRLRILIPLVKGGGYQPATEPVESQGTTITLSAANLIGYETSYYAVEGREGHKVRLRFSSAQISKDDKTIAEKEEPTLPFPLPTKAAYIRLLYLIRSSRTDHNMAIIGARDRRTLQAFTTRVRNEPDACRSFGSIFCTWVPPGIAVRPQSADER